MSCQVSHTVWRLNTCRIINDAIEHYLCDSRFATCDSKSQYSAVWWQIPPNAIKYIQNGKGLALKEFRTMKKEHWGKFDTVSEMEKLLAGFHCICHILSQGKSNDIDYYKIFVWVEKMISSESSVCIAYQKKIEQWLD